MEKSSKTILIGKNKILVDKEDFPLLSRHKWFLNSDGYARKTYGGVLLTMHTLIIPPKRGFVVDHINGNTLDNRKDNLRHLTNHKNLINSKRFNGKYVGVSWHSSARKWRARCKDSNGKEIHLGLFKSKKDALDKLTSFKKQSGVL